MDKLIKFDLTWWSICWQICWQRLPVKILEDKTYEITLILNMIHIKDDSEDGV